MLLVSTALAQEPLVTDGARPPNMQEAVPTTDAPGAPAEVVAAIHGAGGVVEVFASPLSASPSASLAGWATRLPESAAHTLVESPPPALAGWTVFLLDESFGYDPDVVAFLPTRDPYAILAAVGTDGINYGYDNAKVIGFLQKIASVEPFVLTGAGLDFVSGRFTTPIERPGRLARMFYRICPDIVDQGTGTVAALKQELVTSGQLYCWWD